MAKVPRSRKLQPRLKAAENKKWEDLLHFHLHTGGFAGRFVRNYRKAIPGRNFELDFADLEHKVGIEVQGATWSASKQGHNSGEGIKRDCIKANLMQLNGWVVLKFTSDMVRDLAALDFIKLFYTSRFAPPASPPAPPAGTLQGLL